MMMNGVLTVYKEAGWTSHDVVAKVRRITGIRKVGHTGTLDPQAEGVLPVCLGPSTRLSGLLTDQDKTYEASMVLGVRTDTQDLTGTVLCVCEDLPDEDAVRAAILSFEGAYDQVPPMYSARKVKGRKLYELARSGETAERTARRVVIDQIEILSLDLPRCLLRVRCSKGTYIRTLCDDIGQCLGCGAAMESLLRTRVGVFTLTDAVKIADLEAAKACGSLSELLIPPDRLFTDLPAVTFLPQAQKAARNGNALSFSCLDGLPAPADDAARVRMYDSQGHFYGIYEADMMGRVCRPVKILTDLSQ